MRRFIIITIAIFMAIPTIAQELRCSVQVNSQKIQGTNKQVFRTMQVAMSELMNTTRWTNKVFSYDERIECTLMFNLTEQISADEFKGTLQIQVSRPVFNTSYNTVLLNFKDKDIQFKYVEFQPLKYSETTKPNELTALLAYYAYVIIGLDFDTFSPEGGTAYFAKAENIVNMMQNSKVSGWKAYESKRNRYWLIENILNSAYSSVRECYYRYHRQGLDRMADKLTDGRSEIADCIRLMQKAYRANPSTFILRIFFDAKADEIVNIFSESFSEEKKRVYNIVKEIDPSHLSKYKKIINQK